MSSFETLGFYRGLSRHYEIAHPTVHATRKNRRPRDMNLDLHNAADDWFYETFGVRYRSQSIFLSSNITTAAAYAATPDHIAKIIPLGPYSYCWSSQLSDLLELCMSKPEIDTLRTELKNSNYKENGLDEAHRLGHEVMLFCESYICIPVNCITEKHD
ncbi:hypothetical protein [Pseudomonas sp. S2_B03]